MRFICAIIPYFKNKYSKNEQAGYEEILNSLKEHNVPYLDLHGCFKDRDEPSWRFKETPDDFVHPSKKGHDVIAENLYSYLMKNLDLWYKDKSRE